MICHQSGPSLDRMSAYGNLLNDIDLVSLENFKKKTIVFIRKGG